MPNISVTTTTNLFIVDFGDYCTSLGVKKGSWPKKNNMYLHLLCDDAAVLIKFDEDREWTISHDGLVGLQIDSVDGVAPSSNLDLYNKLKTALE